MIAKSSSVLVVDDEQSVLVVVKGMLSEGGYQVYTAQTALEAMELLEQQTFDVLLLDLKLPGPSGLVLAERARELQDSCAIIMFSASPTREHLIEALRASIDDFLIKPINGEQLRQAVGRALLKRRQRHKPAAAVVPKLSELIIGSLKINLETHAVQWHGRMLSLTPTEYCLLLTLAQHVGQSVSPSLLVRRCRAYSATDAEARALLKPHIANLRQKLEEGGHSKRVLVNHRGVGFILYMDEDMP